VGQRGLRQPHAETCQTVRHTRTPPSTSRTRYFFPVRPLARDARESIDLKFPPGTKKLWPTSRTCQGYFTDHSRRFAGMGMFVSMSNMSVAPALTILLTGCTFSGSLFATRQEVVSPKKPVALVNKTLHKCKRRRLRPSLNS